MTATEQQRVELYVRSLSSRTGQQDDFIEQLRRLSGKGTIASFAVCVWGERVPLSTLAADTARGQEILDTIARLRQWGRENGASLEPFFTTRETDSTITGETYATLRLPAVLLAERVDGRLVCVRPAERDGTVLTVGDRLETLLAHDRPGTDPVSP